ncbi:MAG: lysylphosphatidylglycerol synthase transmembrane domain-containing protein, partial [Dehalococcoidia bacterium]
MAGDGPTPNASDVPRVSIRRKAIVLPTLLSFAIAGLFIFFLLVRFDIDLGDAWRKARGSDPGLLAAAFVLYYLTFPLRGYRWRILLENAGAFKDARGPRPSLLRFSEMILVSWFTNSITWFRLGDAYRAFMLSSGWRIGFPRVIGTVVAERVLDVGVVLALLLVAGVGLLRGDTAETAGAV